MVPFKDSEPLYKVQLLTVGDLLQMGAPPVDTNCSDVLLI